MSSTVHDIGPSDRKLVLAGEFPADGRLGEVVAIAARDCDAAAAWPAYVANAWHRVLFAGGAAGKLATGWIGA